MEEHDDCAEASLVNQVYLYITEKRYPAGCTDVRKRSIRKKAKTFSVKEGELYYVKQRKGKTVELRYIRRDEERKQIMRSCHVHPTSAHMGVKKTFARVAERFYWKGMYDDVAIMLYHCETCQRSNRSQQLTAPKMQPVKVTSPWDHIGIDFVSISPTSQRGNKYVLTICDYMTKFVQAVALPTKEAPAVAAALYKIFMTIGLPRVITSDNGKEFRNVLDTELSTRLSIKRIFTAPYHPQANGLVERFNQTLQNILGKVSNAEKHLWDEFLDCSIYAYNTSKHESTQYSPFQLMFGRQGLLPIELDAGEPTPSDMKLWEATRSTEIDDLQSLAVIAEKRQEDLVAAKQNILQAQQKQKSIYDRRHGTGNKFQVDDLVLRKDFTRKKRAGGKLDPRFLGPFRVVGKYGMSTLLLKENGGNVRKVNSRHVKKFVAEDAGNKKNDDDSADSSDAFESDLNASDTDTDSVEMDTVNNVTKSKKDDDLADGSDALESDSNASDPEAVSFQIDTFENATKSKPLRATTSSAESSATVCYCRNSCARKICICRKNGLKCTERCHPGKPQCVNKDVDPGDIIVINSDSASDDSHATISPPVKLLSPVNRQMILSGGWLNDTIVTNGEMLLTQEFPLMGGLQDTIKSNSVFGFDVERGTYVQVLHIPGHWITVSNVGCTARNVVNIYDSLHGYPSSSLQEMIADIIQVEEKSIVFQVMNVQRQRGGSDCGLFALAYATSLCNGSDPTEISYDQGKMRKHLVAAFDECRLREFPRSRDRVVRTAIIRKISTEVYCSCRKPKRRLMVACDGKNCPKKDEWYHPDCVGLGAIPHTWLCPECR